MKTKTVLTMIVCTILPIAVSCSAVAKKWGVHDMARPLPEVITPGNDGSPPSDAIVLFDGKDMSQWVSDKDGSEARWKVENGYCEVTPGSGNISTKQKFGDCQLHIEWASPTEAKGPGQKFGNSGVYFMGLYEVQVLNSYENHTYADGQAAAVYGQNPPLVNACRRPGTWQSYDIIFHRPVFKDDKIIKPATITVLHNGVLVQDNFEIVGVTAWKKVAVYHPHPDKLSLKLQNHGDPVKYRNIWIREL